MGPIKDKKTEIESLGMVCIGCENSFAVKFIVPSKEKVTFRYPRLRSRSLLNDYVYILYIYIYIYSGRIGS